MYRFFIPASDVVNVLKKSLIEGQLLLAGVRTNARVLGRRLIFGKRAKNMDKAKAIELLLSRLSEWENKSKGTGYVYEESFKEVMRGLNADLLQLSVGEVP